MGDILKCCKEFETLINDRRTTDEIFESCANKRLMNLYKEENKNFDKLLNKLETSIDYNSNVDIKKCVSKLLRMIGNDRRIIMNIIKGDK
jgi:hypothetical protein